MYGTGGGGVMNTRRVGTTYKAGRSVAASALGIEWMSRVGLSQAIPPAYTQHIGAALLAAVTQTQQQHR